MTPEDKLLVAEARSIQIDADIAALDRTINMLKGQRDRLTREQFAARNEAHAARVEMKEGAS